MTPDPIFDELNASVIIMRTDYPGLKPEDRWTGQVSVKLQDGTTLRLDTKGRADPSAVLDELGAILHRRVTAEDKPSGVR